MNVARAQLARKKGPAPRQGRRRLCSALPAYVNRTHSAAYRASRSRIAMMWTIGVSPPSLGYFLRAPPRSRAPSGGHRGGRRLEPIEVPQDGLDEADEGRSDPAIGPDRSRPECLDGHAAGVLIAQIALQVRVVDARPSRVRILGHHQIFSHHVLFRSRVRLRDVHGGSRPVRGLERHIGGPVNLLSTAGEYLL